MHNEDIYPSVHPFVHLFTIHSEDWKSSLNKSYSVFLQILIGLRDTDDTLVSATLYALSNLVPILGGAVVVGGERQKYFKEGRPKVNISHIFCY